MRLLATTVSLCLLAAGVAGEDRPEIPAGTEIATITINRLNVFDLSNPEEDNALFRLANRLHIVTRDSVIRNQLLFAEGASYNQNTIDETERILRSNRYLWDAAVETTLREDGKAEITVTTKDLWTLTPEISLSRSGGEDKTALGFEEDNLFGRGQHIVMVRTDDVDRVSNIFEFSDRQLGPTWVGLNLRYADNSDGQSVFASIDKPFHSLDARWSGGAVLFDDTRRTALYSLGDEVAEFRHERDFHRISAGWSKGLVGNWAQRFTIGMAYDAHRFSMAASPSLPALIPPNRKLVYPFVAYEIIENRFERAANSDQMDRAEDFFLGTRFAASLGWADSSWSSDRDAWVWSAAASTGLGSMSDSAVLMSVSASGRREGGRSANVRADASLRYYSRQSEKSLFFASLSGTVGNNLDIDNPVQIGGDNGMRGYPLRYQSGESRVLFTVEQRYFTDWYPFRLARVGAAVFADIGRTYGPNPVNEPDLGWLRDVGIGLRLAPTRLGTKKVIHIDLAFPLDGDADIDDVQLLVESKGSF